MPTIYRGDSWKRVWRFTTRPANPDYLVGASARLHLRDTRKTLVISAASPTASLSIVPDQEGGTIYLNVPAAQTQSLKPGKYFFDLEVTFSDSTVLTVEQATLTVLEDYTHD